MVNVNKLKAKIVENGINVETLADRISMDRATLYRRLKDSDMFTIGEAEAISRALSLTADEVNAIFFAQFVA